MSGGQILLVDDNAEFRNSAAWWLEGMGYAVQSFADPASFLAHARAYVDEARTADAPAAEAPAAACVLLDVRMPQLSGLQVHDELKALGLTWPIVYMTGHGDVPLAVEAMQKGAVHFIEKPFREDVLEAALETAFAHLQTSPPLPTTPASAGTTELTEAQREYMRRIDLLTAREREVLLLVVDGRLNKNIADTLGISIKTVELHRSRVMGKMQARSLTTLMRMVVSREVTAG